MTRTSKAQVGNSEVLTWLRNQKRKLYYTGLPTTSEIFVKGKSKMDKWKNKVVDFRCRWILFALQNRVELSIKGCKENPPSKP